jgi:NADP-dependent 3-hydroxy acid dehydrogenase YdfG
MIKDKVVVITGALSGIGEATAMLLASKGAKIVLGAWREDKLKQIVDPIEKKGGQAAYQTLDVTKQSENDAIVKLAKDKFGRIDVIFLNAGLMPNSPLSALKTNEWNQMVDVNIKGVLNGAAKELPQFDGQKSGQVIATSSVADSRLILAARSTAGRNGSCATSWRFCARSRPWRGRTSAPQRSIPPQSIPNC